MGDTVDKLIVREKDVTIVVDVKCEPNDVAFIKHTASLITAYMHAPTKLRRIQHIMSADMGVQLAKLSLLMEGEKDGNNSSV